MAERQTIIVQGLYLLAGNTQKSSRFIQKRKLNAESLRKLWYYLLYPLTPFCYMRFSRLENETCSYNETTKRFVEVDPSRCEPSGIWYWVENAEQWLERRNQKELSLSFLPNIVSWMPVRPYACSPTLHRLLIKHETQQSFILGYPFQVLLSMSCSLHNRTAGDT